MNDILRSTGAVELDPNLARANSAVGDRYATLNQPARAREYDTKPTQLREHAHERENLKITADYYNDVYWGTEQR